MTVKQNMCFSGFFVVVIIVLVLNSCILFQTWLFYLIELIVWNIKVILHWVAKIKGLEDQSLWQFP